jgi:hypothetical protein
MVIIVWLLDLQLLMQSVPITTKVESLNPAHDEVYSIKHYVIKFVSDFWQVGGFLYTTLCDQVCQWLLAGRWFSLYNIMWSSLSVTFDRSVVFSIHHYVIKFVSDFWQVGGFLWVLLVSSTNKTDHHDIAEIL